MKRESGITLIALVITIIVLLILAGVTIGLLVGEDGILYRTQEAVKLTKKSIAEEQVYLAWASAKTEYYTDSVYNSSVDDTDYFKASNLTKYVSQGEIVNVRYKMNEDGDSIVIYKDNTSSTPVYYTVTIKGNGQVIVDNDTTTPNLANLEELEKVSRFKRNTIDAIEMVQTAEGGLSELHSMLQRMNELSIQASNGTSNAEDRQAIAIEMEDLVKEIDRLSVTVQYKVVTLLDGSISDSSGWRVELEEETLIIPIPQVNSSTLNLSSVDVSSEASAIAYSDKISIALDFISSTRSKLGNRQNQLEYIVDYYDTVEAILENNLAETETKKQIASVGATEILGMLNRIDELAVQATANLEESNINACLDEAVLLKEGIGILSDVVGYKGQKLLDGSYSGITSLKFNDLYVDFMTDANIQRTREECANAITKVEGIINNI